MKNSKLLLFGVVILIIELVQPCDINCESCDEANNTCIRCNPEKLLFKGNCYDECPYFFHPEPTEDGQRYRCKKIEQSHSLDENTLKFFERKVEYIPADRILVRPINNTIEKFNLKLSLWLKMEFASDIPAKQSILLLTSNYGLISPISYGNHIQFMLSKDENTFKLQFLIYNTLIYEILGFDERIWNKIGLNITNKNGTLMLNDDYFYFDIRNRVRWHLPDEINLLYFGNVPKAENSVAFKFYEFKMAFLEKIDLFEIRYYINIEKKLYEEEMSFERNTSYRIRLQKDRFTVRFLKDFLVNPKSYSFKCSLFGITDEYNSTIMQHFAEINLNNPYDSYSYSTVFQGAKRYHYDQSLSPTTIEMIYVDYIDHITRIKWNHDKYEEIFEIEEDKELYLTFGSVDGIDSCNFNTSGFILFHRTLETETYNYTLTQEEILSFPRNYEEMPNCTVRDGRFCLKCEKGTLHHLQCLESCPLGFKSVNNFCQLQVNRYCLDLNCTNCHEGYIKFQDGCIKNCSAGEWSHYNSSKREYECLECPIKNCDSCIEGFCTKCHSGYFLFDGTCVNNCPYQHNLVGDECIMCGILGCSQCEEGECIECENDLLLYVDNGTCLKSCPEGTLLIEEKYCIMNDTNCLEYKPKGCVECLENKLSYRGKCVDSCPHSHQYRYHGMCRENCNGFSIYKQYCRKCPKDCLSCNIHECTSCVDNYVIQSRSCQEDCHPAFIANNSFFCNYFEKIEHCSVPSSEHECLYCKPKYFKHQGICTKACPEGFVKIQQRCTIKCEDGQLYLAEEQKCVDSCPSGFYQSGKTCKKCLENCKICEDDHSCFSCSTPHYHLDYQSNFLDCEMKPHSFSEQKTLDRCSMDRFCIKNVQCSSSYLAIKKKTDTHCLTCSNSFSYNQVVGSLISGISVSLMKVNIKYPSCYPCDSYCERCNHTTEECELCKKGYYKTYYGSCSPECPQSHFKNELKRECLGCEKDCVLCSKFDHCILYIKKSNSASENNIPSPYRYFRSTQHYIGLNKMNDIRVEFGTNYYFLPDLDPCFICNAYYKHREHHLSDYIPSLDCLTSCSKRLNCDEFCELCDEINPKICFKCSRDYQGMLLKNGTCSCIEHAPYLDHGSKKCLAKCPAETFILEKNKECLHSCFFRSLVDETLYPFTYRRECVNKCPPGTYGEIYYSFFDKIICREERSIEKYMYIFEKLAESQKLDTNMSEIVNTEFEVLFEEYAKEFENGNAFELSLHANLQELVLFYIPFQKKYSNSTSQFISSILESLIIECRNVDMFDEKIAKFLEKASLSMTEENWTLSYLRVIFSKASCYHKNNLGKNLVQETLFGKLYFASITYLSPKIVIEDKYQLEFDMDGIYYQILFWMLNSSYIAAVELKYYIHHGPFIVHSNDYDHGRENIIRLYVEDHVARNASCFYIDIEGHVTSFELIENSTGIFCPIRIGSIFFIGVMKEIDVVTVKEEEEEESEEFGISLVIIILTVGVLVIVYRSFFSKKSANKTKFVQLQNITKEDDELVEEEKNDEGEDYVSGRTRRATNDFESTEEDENMMI